MQQQQDTFNLLVIKPIQNNNQVTHSNRLNILFRIKIEPNNLTILQNLGTAHKELGEFDEAIKLYNKVLNINPKHTNSNYNLGLVFYKMNEIKKAKIFLKKTVDMQSNYALAFFSLANVHSDLKEYNDAVSCYQKSIEINPKGLSSDLFFGAAT